MKKRSILTLLGMVALLLSSVSGILLAQDDEEASATIVDVAGESSDFRRLVTALDVVGLTSVLEGTGPFTVFAPTDAAFEVTLDELGLTIADLMSDTELLSRILTYHVAPGDFNSESLLQSAVLDTLNGELIDLDPLEDGLALNDTINVIDTDITASNGVIHVIDAVLIPSNAFAEEAEEQAAEEEAAEEDVEEIVEEAAATVVDVAASASDFSTLVAALDAADLTSTLEAEGPFTVFAPTNEAFDAALDELGLTIEDLLADSDLLSTILTFHVAPGNLPAEELAKLPVLLTLNGGQIDVAATDDGLVLNDSINVLDADLIASNGVVHAIDSVLIPANAFAEEAEETAGAEAAAELPTLVEALDEAGNFEILLNALDAADIDELLLAETSITVFAPTDDALLAFIADNALGASELGDANFLNALLAYHAVRTDFDSESLAQAVVLETFTGELIDIDPLEDGAIALNDTVNIIETDLMVSNGIVHIIDSVLIPPGFGDAEEAGEETAEETAEEELLNVAGRIAFSYPSNFNLSENRTTDIIRLSSDEGGSIVIAGPNSVDTVLRGVDEDLLTTYADRTGLEVTGDVESSDGVDSAAVNREGAAGTLWFVDAGDGRHIAISAFGTDAADALVDSLVFTPDVLDLITGDEELSTLRAAIQAAGLNDTLINAEAVTVFAPNNAAFDAVFAELEADGLSAQDLLTDRALLETILTYHVVGAERASDTLAENPVVTTLNGLPFTAEAADDGVIINGSANVVTADTEARNGLLHVIDAVLIPPNAQLPEPPPPEEEMPDEEAAAVEEEERPTIVEALDAAGNFELLLNALDVTDLDALLLAERSVTLFAPTDEALSAFFEENDLNTEDLDDVELLSTLLSYHATPTDFDAAGLVQAVVLESFNGALIDVDPLADGAIALNDTVNIIESDLFVSNGVIHTLDAVLVPPNFGGAEEEAAAPELIRVEGRIAFSYPSNFNLSENRTTDIIRLSAGDASIVISGPRSVATVLRGVEDDLLTSYADRTGLEVTGDVESSDGVASADVNRDSAAGTLWFVDAGDGRHIAISAFGTDAAAALVDSLVFTPDVLDLVTGNDELGTLRTAIQAAGLNDTLINAEAVTVFGPNNAAFDALFAELEADHLTAEDILGNRAVLETILTYHVVGAERASDTLAENPVVTTLNGLPFTAEVTDDGVIINGSANVVAADSQAGNGIVHVIDAVLLPPDLQLPDPQMASVSGRIAFSYPAAFNLTENPTTDIIRLSTGDASIVISGPRSVATVLQGVTEDFLTTYADRTGLEVTGDVESSDGVSSVAVEREGARGTLWFVDAGDGRHVAISAFGTDAAAALVDSLVFTPDVLDLITGNDELSTLRTAIQAAGLNTNLIDAEAVTAFAPNNAAFDALFAEIEADHLTAQDLLGDRTFLETVLNYHLVAATRTSDTLADSPVITTLNGLPFTAEVTDDGVIINGTANVVAADTEASNGVLHVIDAVLIPPNAVFPDPTLASLSGRIAFSYPQAFDLTENMTTDIIRLSTDNASMTVAGPRSVAIVLRDSGEAEPVIAYAEGTGLDITGVVESRDAISSVAVEREGVRGTLWLIDTGNGRIAVSAFGTDAGQIVVDSLVLTPNIQDLVSSNADLSLLNAAVRAAGLTRSLIDAEALTVFAPTNEAVEATVAALGITVDDLLADTELLNRILPYHIVEGTFTAEDIVALNGQTLTTLGGDELTVTATQTGVVLQDARGNNVNVIVPDVAAFNGVVHQIDAVLLPPRSILETIEADDEVFGLLSTLLDNASPEIEATLAGEGPFTIFAPDDIAVLDLLFAAEMTLPELLRETDTLNNILLYHVVEGELTSDDLLALDGEQVDTLLPNNTFNVSVRADGTIVLNGIVEVTTADIEVENGIIHVVEDVLLPFNAPLRMGTLSN